MARCAAGFNGVERFIHKAPQHQHGARRSADTGAEGAGRGKNREGGRVKRDTEMKQERREAEREHSRGRGV